MYDLTDIKTKNIKPYKVRKVITHEEFQVDAGLNDIGLIILAEEVQLDSQVQVACLPDPFKLESDFPGFNSPAWLSGWGLTKENSTKFTKNQKNVQLNILDPVECTKNENNMTLDWSRQMCGGLIQEFKGACVGDSGSGLFVKKEINNKAKFVVAGITSYGLGKIKKAF